MKIVSKLITYTLISALIGMNTFLVSAEGNPISVENVKVEDTRNVKAALDNEVAPSSITSSNLKIKHDILILDAEIDTENRKKAIITLNSELTKNTEYNLIGMSGADGNMDFSTISNLANQELMNDADDGIESIKIVNPTRIEITYFEEIPSNKIEIKLLRDVKIESMEAMGTKEISLKTGEDLKVNTSYIFMLLAAENVDNTEATIEGGIFEFETPASLGAVSSGEEIELNSASENTTSTETTTTTTQSSTENTTNQASQTTSSEQTSTATASTKTNTEATTEEETSTSGTGSNIEQVAAEATVVPEAGAATNILIVITLLMTAGIQMRKFKR